LIAGVLLAVAELFTLDFVLIMLAAGAFGAAAVGLFGAGVLGQAVTFTVVSALGMFMVRPAIKHRLHTGAEPALMGVDAIEGAEAKVVEEVAEGRGQVKIGGDYWQARPYDVAQVIEAGTTVRVVEVKGAIAMVWRE
jgi:membrane protein implicated in regulation of membrane protease activity